MNELVKATKFQQAIVWVVSLVLLSGCGSGGEDTSGPSDSTSPVLSSVQVSNITPTSAAITFNTDEQAAAVVDYADEAYYSANSTYNLSESQTSYLTSHTQTLSNLAPATTYHYRITITDSASNATVDTDRTFTTPAQQDTAAPVISNPMPTPSSALPTGTTSTTLGVSTDEAAQCRYATSASIAYASMPNSFTTTGLIAHSTMLTGLTDGGAYGYYIRCQDGSGNANTSDYTITFSVATAGGGNLPPVLAFIADIVVTEGETVSFSPSATDADGDNLSFSYSGWMTSSSYITRTGDAGTHTVTVTVDDGNGGTDRQSVTVTVNPPPDVTPPVISATQVSNITDTTATVGWSTDEPADSLIQYGLTATYGNQVSSNSLVSSHTLNLTGLTPNTAYHYTIQSRDAAGNLQTTSDATFTTHSPSVYQCNDGLDNDGDTLVDLSDPGCSSATDNDETDPPTGLPAWVDTNSPLALKMHPRLFLIPDSYRSSNPNAYGISLSEMRQKLNTDYKTEFQTFISVMDTEYTNAASGKVRRDMVNDATNFAFLYILDPSMLSQAPYNFTFAYSQADYGAKAKEHLLEIASNVIGFNGLPYSGGWADVVHLVDRGHITVSMSMVYDWIFPILSLAEKQTVADAFIDSYNNRVVNFAGRDYFPRTNNGTISIMQNGTLGALAMWGDAIDNGGSTHYIDNLNTLLDAVKHDWIERVFDWMNYIGEGSSNWAEGPLYNGASYGDFARVFHLMGTPLNYDYYSNSSYFVDRPLWTLFNIHPSKNSQSQTVWYHFDDDDPSGYFLGCKSCYYGLASFYNSAGTLYQSHPDSASLAKWIKDDSGYSLSSSISSSHNDVRYYYLLSYFMWGDKTAQSKSPSQLNIPLSKKLGHGQYVMKTGFETPDDSQIVFWAPKYFEQQSHAHIDFASFTISKYGNLAVQRSVAKKFSGGNLHQTARSMFYNTIGVYKPGEVHYDNYNLMGYRTNYDASAKHLTDPAYQTGGANHVGDVIAEDLEASNYDYVNYDYSRAWDSTKVDYANRQFVYLRSQGGANDEYVVVLDRVNAVDPNYTKYYLLHSSFAPSITADTIEITNNWAANSSHGKLFNKILLPTNYQINQISDWQDADGNIIHSAAGLTDEERNYRGSVTVQIESTAVQNHETYLNVMQLGDANTLTSMTPVVRIDAGSMVGAVLDDPTVARVVLFSSDQHGAAVGNVSYTVGALVATLEKHLLLGMLPGSYDVYQDSTLLYSNLSVSEMGVLAFDSADGSIFQVVKR